MDNDETASIRIMAPTKDSAEVYEIIGNFHYLMRRALSLNAPNLSVAIADYTSITSPSYTYPLQIPLDNNALSLTSHLPSFLYAL